jgi:membrane-bound serine protease (ClpP class)
VRNSVSITERQAVENKVVDLIAQNEQQLLTLINGRIVELNTGNKTINTTNIKVDRIEMNLVEKLLALVSDPNIAYILMMLGFYGILFELYSPGTILPGVIGGICLILAFYAMHALPLNYAGLALIIFAIILFILEVKITSYGILGIGGVIALVLGSMMLIKNDSALQFLRISWGVIISTTVVTALFFFVLIAFAVKGQRAKPISGLEGLVGKEGETLARLEPVGMVRVHGELWKAESVSGSIEPGQRIRVTAIKDLTLFVEPIK